MANLDNKLIVEAGLSPERILVHAERIRAALSNATSTSIPVVGACTVENGQVVSWSLLEEWVSGASSGVGEACFADLHRHWQERHVVTAIPAAGAASRFLGEIQKFVLEAESKVPGLKELTQSFLEKDTHCELKESARETAVAALGGLPVPDRFKGLPEALFHQEFDEVRLFWMRLSAFLLDLLESGELATDTKAALVVEAGENHPLRERTLSDMRRPWNTFSYQEKTVDEDEGDCSGCESGDCSEHGGHDDGHSCAEAECEASLEAGSFEFDTVHFYAAAKALVTLYAGIPKALVPTTDEGDTFLRLKLVEQISLMPCLGNVLIVPAGQVESTRKVLEKEGEYLRAAYVNPFELAGTPFSPRWLAGARGTSGRWDVQEQGVSLSTIRFHTDGSPVLDNGRYSLVAAGHGELVHLFDGIAREFPGAECLHIRNIDNVIGAGLERQMELSQLSDSFRLVRDGVEFLREVCTQQVAQGAQDARLDSLEVGIALEFLAGLLPQQVAERALASCLDAEGEFAGVPAEAMYDILGELFTWPKERPSGNAALWSLIMELIDRPLSVFGVVRKEDGDVGGGPVLVKTPDGQVVKICLEMPHAGPEDAKAYFGSGGKATHFNPVLAFFELRTHTRSFADKPEPGRICDFRRLFDDRFWMLSRKEFQGKPVCYHETVLYELIGNSATTNLIFVEVPRSLFNPHKTMFDSLGRTRESYGFHETLGEPEICGEGA